MATLPAVLGLVCLTLTASSCARRRAVPDRATPSTWSLAVENHHWLDVEVYVMHGGQTTRVGLVTATTTQNFVLPAYLLVPGGGIQLAAHAIGGGQDLRSEVITLSGGERVEWTLERSLLHGSLSVH